VGRCSVRANHCKCGETYCGEKPNARKCCVGKPPTLLERDVIGQLARRRRAPRKRRVLPKDCPFELAELGAGFQTKLVGKETTRFAIDLQCLGLSAAPVERQNQLAA
jgi:hypothetical protein